MSDLEAVISRFFSSLHNFCVRWSLWIYFKLGFGFYNLGTSFWGIDGNERKETHALISNQSLCWIFRFFTLFVLLKQIFNMLCGFCLCSYESVYMNDVIGFFRSRKQSCHFSVPSRNLSCLFGRNVAPLQLICGSNVHHPTPPNPDLSVRVKENFLLLC